MLPIRVQFTVTCPGNCCKFNQHCFTVQDLQEILKQFKLAIGTLKVVLMILFFFNSKTYFFGACQFKSPNH